MGVVRHRTAQHNPARADVIDYPSNPNRSEGHGKDKSGTWLDGKEKSGTGKERSRPNLWALLAVISCLVVVVLLLEAVLARLWFLRVVTLLPVVACLWRTLSNPSWMRKLLPLTVVSTTIFAQLPAFLGSAFAAACIVMFSLNTLPSQHQNRSKGSPMAVLSATILLVTILLTENFMVWVVSATFEPGHSARTAPPPLQDNGRAVLLALTDGLTKREVVGLRRLWNVQGALVACLGASFVLAEIYGRRQLYNLGRRAVLTLAAARTIRTVSFLATVVPSQNRYCYVEHYPNPPPTDWKEWIWVGLQPAAHGGCNDLIISGHATVTSTLACVSASVSEDPVFCVAIWAMVALDYMVEIYEGFHYSVDMWLGMVLVCLLWRVLQPVEENVVPDDGESSLMSDNASRGPKLSRNVRIVVYSAPALLAYLQLVLLPSWAANFLVVAYTVATAVLYLVFSLRSKDPARAAAFLHVTQHVLFCLLYMALGIYL